MALFIRHFFTKIHINYFSAATLKFSTFSYKIKPEPIVQLSRFGGENLRLGKVPLQNYHNSLLLRVHLKSSVTKSQPLSKDVEMQTFRLQRRKKTIEDEVHHQTTPGLWHVTAYATSEEYDLEKLREELIKQDLYIPVNIMEDPLTKGGADVIHAVAHYQVSSEYRHIYFFREGSVVFWNIPELECISVLDFLNRYQIGSYNRELVLAEREIMPYSYVNSIKKSGLIVDKFCISSLHSRNELDVDLDKFTLSNAMSLSVKLGIWEASLNQYIDSIEYVVEDLKSGKSLRISRKEVTCKTGELFALRHSINLSSDLLDIPDFYWENDELETLYLQLCSYFSISRRTRVMNEKLNHCMELVELLTSHLSDRHHVRLEWMIIILIMIEVVIEILHARH